MKKDLKEIWNELLLKYSQDKKLIDKLWQKITNKYTEENREYHNLDHLRSIFTQLEKIKFEIKNIEILSFSIWYHDIIYNPTKKDNEKRSAEEALKVLKILDLPESQIKECYAQIMLTKDHLKKSDTTLDAKYFLDFDLEILSRPWEEYKSYSERIRKEYWMYSDTLYKKGRKEALEKFLSRKEIYYTEYYKPSEFQARLNIEQELDHLKI